MLFFFLLYFVKSGLGDFLNAPHPPFPTSDPRRRAAPTAQGDVEETLAMQKREREEKGLLNESGVAVFICNFPLQLCSRAVGSFDRFNSVS